MVIEKKAVAIITARGGSKRIPGKNKKEFCGQPIILYSVKAAVESQCFDEVMVSTDDEEIAELAKKAGANIPFMRSAENANDFATTIDVVKEVLDKYMSCGKKFDYFCCLYPTAPFVTAKKLSVAMETLEKQEVDSVLPIVQYSFPPQRSFCIEDGFVKYQWPENMLKRSQDLQPIYHDAGQFYCGRVDAFLEQHKLVMERTVPVILSDLEVQDIDNTEDWAVAEMKYRILVGEKEW